ncbi:MAG: polysaccharide deacetylase family protein [Proteobacteria bacterium]|nr:polysaccharide deacetylase family protein [Pseudomonadota bacterium]
MRLFLILVGLWVSCISFFPASAFAEDEDSAIIIMYHRFGEEKYPATNIQLDQFDLHIAELLKDQYNIVSLKVIVDALKNGKKLPERTVAITIDDGFLSIYKEAWPRLKKADLPFTLFLSTDPINDQLEDYMTWDQVREMANDPLVDIGHHGHSHDHLLDLSDVEVATDITLANQTYQNELGFIPDLFAYPFGEFSEKLIDLISPFNFTAAFGQYSSPANSNRNIMALPRFAFNEAYSDTDRFKLILNARALPVKDILPRLSVLENNPPVVGFTVNEEINGLNNLSCFPSHMDEPATVNLIGDTRVEIRFDIPFPEGRQRINCTMLGPDTRWYWFGMPFFIMAPTP